MLSFVLFQILKIHFIYFHSFDKIIDVIAFLFILTSLVFNSPSIYLHSVLKINANAINTNLNIINKKRRFVKKPIIAAMYPWKQIRGNIDIKSVVIVTAFTTIQICFLRPLLTEIIHNLILIKYSCTYIMNELI